MKELINFKGYFKIQMLDKNNCVLDEYEDKNLIMETARQSMSEIFSSINQSSISKVVLGTLGHNGDIVIPKEEEDGFNKNRTRLFSEYITITDIVTSLKKNDCVKYIGEGSGNNGTTNNYYVYLGPDINITIAGTNFNDTNIWENLGAQAPYTYSLQFDLPKINNHQCDNLKEYEYQDVPALPTNLGSSVSVSQINTSTTFTIDIPVDVANYTGIAPFTEAALYANERIFSMKTFRVKLKDSTAQLRLIWTISF